ncbi:uncharacterized protein LOC135824489 [Sycon ciliatum]|uniref:uncharacterized protein LOC135824489 n=1 Tax=Sycon ciliatum TaxID=27933 RepID=UPI0020A8A117|eukprot:scpid78956/ scgid25279/ Tyrosine-protein kinase BTK; Agammaglobulinaemia tyrosine kinase; B-cell progenitor kinase; Bruton tyrosine kinase
MNQFGAGASSAVNHLRATTNQWHHPFISRSEGAQLLEGCEAGSFILRESSKGGSYALSVVLPSTGSLGHYLVEKRGPERFCLQGSENSFCAIEELLAHYHHHDSIGLPCRLRLPQRHSSSMSYPSRPNLPALPPRNNSRAGSVSRPTNPRAQPKMPQMPQMTPTPPPQVPGAVSSKPHLDVGRTYPYPPIAPVGSPVVSRQSHPVSSSDDWEQETYEDMSSSGVASVAAAARHSHPVPPSAHTHPVSSADDWEQETYEDMSSSGVASARPGSASRVPPPSSPRHHHAPAPAAAVEDEFGETYEDMSVNSALRQSAHAMTTVQMGGGPSMGASQMGAAPMEAEDGEMYEDMASVSPSLRR